MSVRIRDAQVRPVRLPMSTPHQTASGTITESPLVLLTLMTDEGVAGQSITFTYTTAALGPTADLMRNICALLVGESVAPAAIAEKLAARFRLLGTQGLLGMALAGIDMALWDALARTHHVPLYRLLGAEPKRVRAYGAIGYEGPARSAAVAEDWAKRGFTGVKAKIGYPTVHEDLETIRAIRNVVGPDVAIMVDYNQSLSPAAAIDRLRSIDDEGLEWIEEPTLAHDFRGHAQIAAAIRTPIQCGENWWGPLDLRHAIEANASDHVMLDVMKVGGVTGWLQAAGMTAAQGLRVSNHLWPEISAQLLYATPTAHWLEYADWWNDVLVEPLQIQNGMVVASEAPGSGIELNPTHL
jgi:mandelate racemase